MLLAPLVGGASLGTSLGALPEATELNLMCASAIAPLFPIRNSAKALEQARFTASRPGPGDARWLGLVRHTVAGDKLVEEIWEPRMPASLRCALRVMRP